MSELTRRQMLLAAPGLALAIAATLGLGPADAEAATITTDGPGSFYAQAGLRIIEQAGWARFVGLNIAVVSLGYDGIHGAQLRPNTHGTRGTVLLNPRFATDPGWVAATLVHEAVHQSLINNGLPYTMDMIDCGWDGKISGKALHEFTAAFGELIFCENAGVKGPDYRGTGHWS